MRYLHLFWLSRFPTSVSSCVGTFLELKCDVSFSWPGLPSGKLLEASLSLCGVTDGLRESLLLLNIAYFYFLTGPHGIQCCVRGNIACFLFSKCPPRTQCCGSRECRLILLFNIPSYDSVLRVRERLLLSLLRVFSRDSVLRLRECRLFPLPNKPSRNSMLRDHRLLSLLHVCDDSNSFDLSWWLDVPSCNSTLLERRLLFPLSSLSHFLSWSLSLFSLSATDELMDTPLWRRFEL